MSRIILISCASKKANKRSKARDMYISPLFQLNLRYASTLNPDQILILSAKYGLLEPEQEIEPYEQTLNTLPIKQVKFWADNVLEQLKKVANLSDDEFIFLAGERYRRYLIPEMKNYKIPLQGLGIGKQLKFLKENE